MLKRTSLVFLISILCFNAKAQTSKINIIPEPVMVTEKPGVFTLKNLYSITIEGNDADTKRVSEYLRTILTTATGFETSAGREGEVSSIRLSLNKQADNELGNEGYVLDVSEKNVSITANKAAGLFYGMQSFIQLLPKEIESSKPKKY